MTQMESPKRKLQKKNDYQRHKLFRKIKRRRKAQAEADQQVAMKQLRKKLKLPKFDRGEDESPIYKKYVDMFNDADSDPGLTVRLVDRNRLTVNPETGDVMEVGGHVYLDPVTVIGKMPDNIKQAILKKIESDRMQDLQSKDRLSPVDPIGEFIVESAAIGKPLELAVKAALYGIGRYGGKLGLKKLQGLAKQKLLEKEFSLSNADKYLVKDFAYSKPGYDHELIISPSKKQKRLQLSQPTYQVYTGDKHKISEVGADIAEDNPFRVFKQDSNILKQNSNQNGLSNSKILSDKIKQGYFNYTKGQEIPLNFDGNYFRVTKNIPQVISEGDTEFKNFPVGEYYSENIDDYYKNVMQPLFDKQGIDPEMRLPRGIITVPENDVGWEGYFDVYPGIPYIKAKSVNGNLIDAIRGGQFNSTYLHEAASHGTDFKIPNGLKEQYRFENFLPSDYKWKPSVKDSKDWEEYRATMNQVRHRLLDTEHLINDKYPSGKELEKAIDNRQMDLIMANFGVANGYGADYYNAYKYLLGKANRTNSYRDWQNVIDFENHIRNSLKYLPAVAPFAIGAKSNDYNSGKDIRIKPSKRGTFTKAAKQHGMSVQSFANRVLRKPSKYSAAMRKKANFAHNAAGWKH